MKKPKDHQRLRMLILGLLYVYIALHLFMWYVLDLKWWGKTAMVGVPSILAGHINASAILIILILLSIFIFGRGFCGWACHMRGAVEFADWAMCKMKFKGYTKLRDNNILLNTRYKWLFRIGSLCMLLMPVFVYWKEIGFHFSYDLLTPAPLSDLPNLDNESLWQHFPLTMFNSEYNLVLYLIVAGLSAVLILFIMSFVCSYFFGHGAFCRIFCPYAVLFQPFLNISPFQKKITRMADCTGCRKCSQACPQGIDVSREIYYHNGKVSNRECIKCYTCIDACGYNVLRDTHQQSAPQLCLVKPYNDMVWPIEERSMQVVESVNSVIDFISFVFALFIGVLFSRLGGFYFFVGAILGYTAFRKIVLFLSSKRKTQTA